MPANIMGIKPIAHIVQNIISIVSLFSFINLPVSYDSRDNKQVSY